MTMSELSEEDSKLKMEETEVEANRKSENTEGPRYYFPHRFRLCLLLSLGVAISFASRSNFVMVLAEVNWTADQRGQMLAAFFFGSVLLQLPGGYIVERFGAKICMGITVAVVGACDLLTPLAVSLGATYLTVLRTVAGIASGIWYPTCYSVWTRWAPRYEMSWLLASGFVATKISYMINVPLLGFLCRSNFLGGWRLAFYGNGCGAFIWLVAWLIFTHNSPDEDPTITTKEKMYIMKNNTTIRKTKRFVRPPIWVALRSLAVWATFIAYVTDGVGDYITGEVMVLYLDAVLGFKIRQSALLACLLILVSCLLNILAPVLSDRIRKAGWLSTKNARKLATALGLVGMAIALTCVALFAGCNRVAVVTLLIIAKGASAITSAGCPPNYMDIAPVFAGLFIGIANFFSECMGFVIPLVVSSVTDFSSSRSSWDRAYLTCAGIIAFGGIQFVIFGEGEELPWAREARLASEQTTCDGKEMKADSQPLTETVAA